jgi:hypothetical protein
VNSVFSFLCSLNFVKIRMWLILYLPSSRRMYGQA